MRGWFCSHPESGLLLTDGLAVFQAFLRTEFSEENLEFWLACEDFKKVKSQSKMAAKAKKIFAEYIAIQACKEVGPQAGPSGPRPRAQWPLRDWGCLAASGRSSGRGDARVSLREYVPSVERKRAGASGRTEFR